MLLFILSDERVYELKTDYVVISVFFVLIYLTLLFIGGYIRGFNYNPMDMSFSGILLNSWAFLSVAFLREYIRTRILVSANNWISAFAVLVFTFSYMDNIRNVVYFERRLLVDYIITVFLPLVVLNIFMVWTAKQRGFLGNIIFGVVYASVPVLSPYLPDITKMAESIILYILLFSMYYIIINLKYKRRSNEAVRPPHPVWVVIFGSAMGVFMLFGFGVFRYIPVAVASDSMKGVFSKGDIVIVEKIKNTDNIKIGDILQYRSGGIAVIHRVVLIDYSEIGGRQFVTKGDHNPAVDLYPVRPSQVVGVYRYHIPYVGYPALLFASESGETR